MATLLIRDVDDAVHAALARPARTHGWSLEGRALEMLRVAAGRETLSQVAARHFGPENGADLDLAPRRDGVEQPPPDFSGPEFAAFGLLGDESPR